MITTPSRGSGIVHFHIFRQPGGADNPLTKKNKNPWQVAPAARGTIPQFLQRFMCLITSGKGAAHFVSFCDMAFSALFRIFLLLSLFIAFFVLNLEKSGKRSAKGCKSRKSHAPLSFCILFQCVKIS